MLNFLDRMAGWWLDWRTDKKIQSDPSLKDIGLKDVRASTDGVNMTFVSPAIAVMADEAAGMLDRNHAENYLQFDMLPRVDRGLRPIRVTVQWANGKSPAERAHELELEMQRLNTEWRTLLNTLEGLQAEANRACQEARHTVDDAVNWGDLGCVEARHVVNGRGEESYQVIIEEASPSASNLQKFVYDYLDEHGFKNVEVTTEW